MLKIMNRHLIFLFLFFSLLANSETFYIDSGPNSQEEVQEALILANPGDTVVLKEGRYEFTDGLSLDVDKVILR